MIKLLFKGFVLISLLAISIPTYFLMSRSTEELIVYSTPLESSFMSEIADVYLTNFRIDDDGVEELQTNSGAIFLIAIPDIGKRDKLLAAFVNAGLDLNEESHLDNNGHTPLNIAIINNDVELVALLIELGAKVTIKKSPHLTNGIDYLTTAVKANTDVDMTAMKNLIEKQVLVERVAVNTF